MKRLLCLIVALAALAPAHAGFEGGRPEHPIFVAGSGYLAEVGTDGAVTRRWRGGNNNDAWRLPNGNILVADGAAWEATPDGKRVWRYEAKEKRGGGVYSAQRLPNGNTLIAENSTGRIFEVAPDGGTVGKVIQVPLNAKDRHQTLRMARRLPNGDTLVCRSGAGIVERYDADLKCVWRQPVPGLAFAAVPDAAGNVYVSCLDRIQLWSPDHRLLWEFVPARAGLPIANMTGLHLLPNGNLVVGCYAYGPNQTGVFEVTPRQTVLWRYVSGAKRDSHMAVQALDPAIAAPNR